MSIIQSIKYSEEELFFQAEKNFLEICGFNLSLKRDKELYKEALEVKNYGISDYPVSGRVAAYKEGIYIYVLKAEELLIAKNTVANEFYAYSWEIAYLDAGRLLLEKKLIKKALERGEFLSESYAPGINGTDIMDIKKLAEILNFEELGISVNESGMMNPAKSVTGAYFSKKNEESPPLEKCKQCLGNKSSCKFCKFYNNKKSDETNRKIFPFSFPESFILENESKYKNIESQEYGIAFDIGTTTVVGMLWDLKAGKYLDGKSTLNSQRIYGVDVISRIHYASENHNNLNDVQGKILADINGIIKFFIENFKLNKGEITQIVVVGNTAMSHLFMGAAPNLIATAPFKPMFCKGLVKYAKELGLETAEKTEFYLLPNLAGYVGSDITAGIIAAEIAKSDKIILQIDIGTNGEIVLAGKGQILICSAAAGPAFEAASLSHGMSAGKGAIEGFSIENGEIQLNIIGDISAKGICGSGIIQAVSELLKIGVIDKSGRILNNEELLKRGLQEKITSRVREGTKGREFVLTFDEVTNNNITITQKDIREVQMAKGAIFSGITILLETMGISENDLDQINIAGAFGNYISAESAMGMGLLPNIDIGKVKFIGNAAGVGASMALFSDYVRNQALEIAETVKHIELSDFHNFQEIFLNSLDF